jgi:F0F1-type ATP synthase assembly protein I
MLLQVNDRMTVSQPPPTPSPRDASRHLSTTNARLGGLLAAGSVMAGLAVFGVGLGWLIDRKHGTAPRWTLILGISAIVLGLYQVVRAGSRP